MFDHLYQGLCGSDISVFDFGIHIGWLIHYVILFCSAKPLEGEIKWFWPLHIFSERKRVPTESLVGACLGLRKQRVHYHLLPGSCQRAWPKRAKEAWPPADLKGKTSSSFKEIIEIMSAISPLNGSCLFTQHYCLTDTHSTWRLGNWLQTVWGRDEICAPVKVLLKHKPDIILSFGHHTVTYFDSLMLRLIKL